MTTPEDSERPEFSAAELFRWQEAGCRLGSSPSPFYAELFGRFAHDCEQGDAPVADLLAQAPMTINAASPLRLFGGVHRGVLAGDLPELSAAWPTAARPAGDVDAAYELLRTLFRAPEPYLLDALSRDPQTNEVGRSAALALGLARVGRVTGRPIRLFEIGSSAGLNLRIDSYFYDGGTTTWGTPGAALHFGPECYEEPADFSGSTPVTERGGCDINPIDATTDEGAVTLMAYVWPDQFARLDRLRRALEIARAVPVVVDASPADEWVDRNVVTRSGRATVLMHSVMWQYLPDAMQQRVTATLAERAARATDEAPLARVSMEPGPRAATMDLAVTVWPGADREVLAHCGGHGPPIRPLA
jgi:hypothetical protein